MANQKEPRRNHYYPRDLIKNFLYNNEDTELQSIISRNRENITDKDQLYVYDKQEDRFFLSSPKNLFVEKDLYTEPDLLSDEPSLEKLFDKRLEAPVIGIVDRQVQKFSNIKGEGFRLVCDSYCRDAKTRKLLSKFIEIQYLRHPQNLQSDMDRSKTLADIRTLLENSEKNQWILEFRQVSQEDVGKTVFAPSGESEPTPHVKLFISDVSEDRLFILGDNPIASLVYFSEDSIYLIGKMIAVSYKCILLYYFTKYRKEPNDPLNIFKTSEIEQLIQKDLIDLYNKQVFSRSYRFLSSFSKSLLTEIKQEAEEPLSRNSLRLV